MSVIYPLSLINTRLGDVVAAIDDGPAAGNLQLLDASGNVLSTLALSDPVGIVSNGVLTFTGMSLVDPAAARSGAASTAQITDSLGVVWISGLTVGTASPGATFDILLSPTNVIVAGQTIAITSATITGH